MTGGIRFWARPHTIRLRPWRRVPFTAGTGAPGSTSRCMSCWSSAVALVLPGVPSDSLAAVLPHNASGLVNPAVLIVPIVLLVLIGLRDKTIFLAARGEQYLPALVFFAVLPFVDMIIALKLLIVTVWFGAGRLEVRPALHQRDPADGQQQPVDAVEVAEAHALPRLPRRPPAVASRRRSWRTSRAPSSRSSRRWCCCSRRGPG